MKKITNMNTGSAKSRFVFGVLGMFIFSLSLSAAEWYVDPVNGNDETPGDISGVVYVSMDEHGAWKMRLARKNLLSSQFKKRLTQHLRMIL